MSSVRSIAGKVVGSAGIALGLCGLVWLRYFVISAASFGYSAAAIVLGSLLAIAGFGKWRIFLFKVFGLRKPEPANQRLERP
jgi:hypothetical protein